MMNILTKILDFLLHEIYSIYLITIFLICGFFSLFIDTDHSYFFGHHKDYIISFFFGLLNIGIGVLLIIIKIIHSRLVF